MIDDFLYHGSPKRFRRLEPKAHYLADHRPVVFATPLREIALASLQPWDDGIFEQGVVGEDPPYMIELRPNAFRDVYGGKRGYLYTLSPDTFYHTDRLTRFEQVSDVSPDILNVEVIEDALRALQNSNMQMIYFEDAEAFRMNDYRPLLDLRTCEGAFNALFDLFSDDLETQKALTIEHIDSFFGKSNSYCYEDQDLMRLRAKVLKSQSLSDIRKALDSENSDSHKCNYMLYPAKFIMHNVKVLRDVEFIHWSYKASEIVEEGFKGRITPHKQTLTRVIPDFVELGEGYIFAYSPNQLKDRTVVGENSYPGYIRGIASVAIEFNFEPDFNELQLIIPVKCIFGIEKVVSETLDFDLDSFF